jgi:ribose transport system substrate-binding protein
MNRKWIALMSVGLLLALVAAGCTPETVTVTVEVPVEQTVEVEKVVEVEKTVEVEVEVPAEEEYRHTIGVMLNSMQHPYITAMLDSIRAECDALSLECIEEDARFDAALQANQVEDLIARGVDGILFFPVDVGAVRPMLQKIKDAGIPTVSYGNRVLDEDLDLVDAVTGEDSYFEGQQVARIVARDFEGQAAKVVIIEGFAGGWVATMRTKGFEDEIAALAPDIEILAKQPADWNRANALKIMEDFLTRYPDLDAVYAHDDDMALGALEAIKAADLVGEVRVYGIGGMEEFLKLLKTGEVHGSVWQSPVDFGVLAVRTINDILEGRNIQQFQYVDMPQIDADNVDDFVPEW